MTKDEMIEKYGTCLRIYDSGEDFADRFTFLPPRWEKSYLERSGNWMALTSGEDPRGISGHCEAAAGPHLGKRIAWADLPETVQSFLRESEFASFAP